MNAPFFELQNPFDKSVQTDELYLREVELIEEFTGKPMRSIIDDYTLPERIRINAYVDYVKSL